MKKTFKPIVSLLIIVTVLASMLSLNVSAASVSFSGGEYNVGKAVNIKVSFTADMNIYAVEGTVSYNSSVLRLNSVSGASNHNGSKFTDFNFGTSGSKTASYTLNFTAIAAGNSNVTVKLEGSDGNKVSTASATKAVKIVTPKPSSNANLGSIKVDGVSLSPAFNAKVTSYSATVKYSVANVNIKGSVADGGATYVGGGSWDLKVGDNSRTLTVTAADGTKKSYTVNIKRMSEQETAAAEEDARNANPLLVVLGGQDYTILNDYTGATLPAGFSVGTATRKESQVAVLNDEHGEYQLYCLVDAEGKKGFYTRDDNDRFTRIAYINANGKMYIIEEPDVKGPAPQGFAEGTRTIEGIEVEVYNYANPDMKDFSVLQCYVDGRHAYYSFDSVEGTMQRALQFDLALNPTDKEISTNADTDNKAQENDKNIFAGIADWFKNMNPKVRTTTLILAGVALLLIVGAIILIVAIARTGKKDNFDDEEYLAQNSDFVLGDDYTLPLNQKK